MSGGPDLTTHERKELARLAGYESTGGVVVPFVSRLHASLEDAGMVWINRKPDGGARVRCSHEGLEVGRSVSLSEGEA